MEDLFSKLKWTFNWKKSDSKALEKGKLPESMKKLLDQAIDAESKLSGDAMRLMKQLDGDEQNQNYKNLKGMYKDSQQLLCALKHIHDFHEMPDNSVLSKETFDAQMQKATHLEKTSAQNKLKNRPPTAIQPMIVVSSFLVFGS